MTKFKGKKVGYARISTADQKLDLQISALEAAGCAEIFRDDGLSGAKRDRPGLKKALDALQPGDQLVVWRLDRLARSLSHLLELSADLAEKEIGLHSITEALDTSTAAGRFLYSILGALAEFERSLIQERVNAGMAAAKQRGQHLGRPKAMTSIAVREAREMLERLPKKEVARIFDVSTRTLGREVAGSRGRD